MLNAKWSTELLKLWCSIVTHLKTGVYNDATNQTINNQLYTQHRRGVIKM